MIANWMLYCVAVGVLLSRGALALERGLRSLGRPTRWVWAGALLLTLAIPGAVRLFSSLRPLPAKARDVEVVRGDQRFAEAARAVAADLSFTSRGLMVMVIDFAPERTPAPASR